MKIRPPIYQWKQIKEGLSNRCGVCIMPPIMRGQTNVQPDSYCTYMARDTPDPIAKAILDTLVYADIFDYALTPDEVQRYLIGVRASRDEIARALNDPARLDGNIRRLNGFLTLPQRESAISSRLHWRAQAHQLWQKARFYARLIAYFPFVRLIAVSGGLAMDNARDSDIDLLIVTRSGRLWLVRGLTVALVRIARLRGDKLCPNFLLTENTLVLPDQDLYNAHEIVQMVPLYGLGLYRKMRTLNAWSETFLPNADSIDSHANEKPLHHLGARAKQFFERLLQGKLGDRIEDWEMTRKIKKLSAQIPADADTVHFSPDVCRGFFSGHGKRILKEYYSRAHPY